jgi:hypothetical protein
MSRYLKLVSRVFAVSSLCLVQSMALAESVGLEVPAAVLNSSESDAFAFRTHKAYTARPDGFYRAFLTNTEVVVYDRNYANVEVTFVSQCKNYDGGSFSAHLTCAATYDGRYDRWVAQLDVTKCTSSIPDHAVKFNFNQEIPNGWYFSGRTGYYQSQSCLPEVAVQIDGRWLVDPVNGSHNFKPQLDLGYSEEAVVKGYYP